ncbi:MAG: PD-(D/E)XK nuclease family protein, partial [Candidatus Kapaibacterium sp.]
MPGEVFSISRQRKIGKIFTTLFSGVADIFVGSFIKIPEPAQQILFALSQLENARLIFGVDYEKKNEQLFALQERLLHQAQQEGFLVTSPGAGQNTNLISFRRSLRQSLFNSPVKSSEAAEIPIYSYAAETMKDELRFAAKRIKELVTNATEPVELSRICIASYRQDEYAPLAREIFREYGIPANITDRARLDRSPLYLAFNALFDLAEFNFSRRSLLRLLSSPYLLITQQTGERVDAANLYEVISEYRLLQGSSSWLEEIDTHIEDIEAQKEATLDKFDVRQIEEDLAKLHQARKDIAVVETLVRRIKGQKTPPEFHRLILEIIKECNVVGQILSSSELMIESGELEFDTRSYRAFTTLLEELIDTCFQLGLEKNLLPLTFYTERIRIAALRTRFAPRAEPGRGVIVTSFEQTIGYEFDHLFVLGMNDGVFPEIYSPSLFHLKEHQPGEDDKLIEQRYLFYQTLCTFRKEAYLLWHTGSDDKKSEIMRSQFADALEEVVPLSEIPKDEPATRVFSSNEFFRYIGLSQKPMNEVIAIAKEKGLDEESLETVRGQIPLSILIEKKRAERALSEYSGVLPFDQLTEAEREELLAYQNRVYSISQLETYAACPFKFFSKYILRLESGLQSEGEEGLSSAERGTVLHETLYQILSGLREQRKDLRSLSDEDFYRISTEILSP